MNFEEYQEKAKETALYPDKHRVVYPALGLGNEAGEVMGKIKKWLRGDDGDGAMSKERMDLLEGELGDVLWYLSVLASDLGLSLEAVAMHNLDKLQSRKERGVIKGDGDKR